MDYDEGDDRRQAAIIIQRKWREYREANGAGAEDGNDEGRELTEGERRAQLLEQFKELIEQRQGILATNLMNQRRVGKKLTESKGQQDRGEASTVVAADAEVKYWQTIQKLHAERIDLESKQNMHDSEKASSYETQQHAIEEALQAENEFREMILDAAKKAVFPRNNKGIPLPKIQEFIALEQRNAEKLHEARLKYIECRNRNRTLSQKIKDAEKGTDGLHLIDFEQLKIENTTLNEKIEERNEDLLKLRKKSTTTIHILTHVKEKLECVKGENVLLQKKLQSLETSLGEQRDKLAQAKRERDAYVNENIRMKEKMPMIGSEDLLLDYELRREEIGQRRIEVVNLTNKHHELVQKITKLQPSLETLLQTVRGDSIVPAAAMTSGRAKEPTSIRL